MTTTFDNIPAHVPSDLVVDFDLYNIEGGADDPQLAWARLASYNKPVLYSPHNGGHWIATRPEDILAIQRDATLWSSDNVTAPKHVGERFLPLECNPPHHTAYRRPLVKLFSSRALRDIATPARELAVGLIEQLQPNGRCDFIKDFAMKFPLTVFLNIMGLPVEDGLMLNRLLDTSVRTADVNEKIECYTRIAQYIRGQVDERLENPRDDGLTYITQGEIDGGRFSRQVSYSIAQMLTQGGIDSVAMHLSFIVIHLAQNPDKRRYVLENLDNLEGIITEYGRRYFINNMFRTVTENRDFHGVQLKAGELIAVNAALFNFNEELFPNAAEVDFERPAKQNLSFGVGPHACLGTLLTRLEVKIFLQEWLPRIPEFEIDPDIPIDMRASQMHGVNQVALVWPTRV